MNRYQVFSNACDGAAMYWGSKNEIQDIPKRSHYLIIDLDTFGIYELENDEWICTDTME